MSLAVHPRFAQNDFIYFTYTRAARDRPQRGVGRARETRPATA